MTPSAAELHRLIRQWRERMAAASDGWSDVDLTFTQLRALLVLGRESLRIERQRKTNDYPIESQAVRLARVPRH